jgi:hypothetical protein
VASDFGHHCGQAQGLAGGLYDGRAQPAGTAGAGCATGTGWIGAAGAAGAAQHGFGQQHG